MRKIYECNRNTANLFRFASSCRYFSSPSVKVQKRKEVLPKLPSPKKDEKNWKIVLMKQLQTDLKDANAKSTKRKGIYTAQSQIVRYAISDDWASLLSFIHSRIRTFNISADQRAVDELVAVSLLVVKNNFSKILDTKGANSADASALCFQFANLLDRMNYGADTTAVTILLYDRFVKWVEMREMDMDSEEISDVISQTERRLSRNVNKFSMDNVFLYHSPADRRIINARTVELGGRVNPDSKHDSDYLKDLKIVDSVRYPVSAGEYLGNPYKTNLTQENMMSYFDENMKRENSSWLRVKNFKSGKENVTESAEALLDGWTWKEKIIKVMKDFQTDRSHFSLKSYLDFLPQDKIAEEIYEAVLAFCSQGQDLVPMVTFQQDISWPITKIIHTKLMSKLGIDEHKIWKEVFEEYSRYFIDSEISRLHTHRTWWEKSCRRSGVRPDYQSPLTDFQTEARLHFESFLTEVALKACVFPVKDKKGKESWIPAFQVQNVSIAEESHISDSGKTNLVRMVKLHQKMLQGFQHRHFDHILFSANELPMMIPPRPWFDEAIGGPSFTKRRPILRKITEFKKVDVNKEMNSRLSSKAQARPVFDALNQLGSTPWRINESLLNVLCQVFRMSSDIKNKDILETLSIPLKSSTIRIPQVMDFLNSSEGKESVPKEVWRDFYKAKSEAEKTRNEHNSLWCWMLYRVVLALHFKDNVLFFPHNMDFRGRVYPISPYLNHMGDDINRCILKFAKGQPLGEHGLRWLKIHCVNLTGKLKKQSISERLQAAEDQMSDILDSANNPLDGKGWWLESEDPWQTLAACVELRDALASENPEEFISHLAVHQDGSCNGLQHYAALGRDRQGGLEVNLLPSELPNDVYSSVAVRVEQKRIDDEQGGPYQEIAVKLREVLPQAVPRKVIKQTVMTTVYGVTMYGAVQQIKRQLKALGIDNDDTAKLATYLAQRTFSSLNDSFTSSMQLKNWFRECAKGTSELLRTVEWITPLGLPVVQPYLRPKESQGKIFLAPIPSKQIDAFPPNFVHSLDSTHMMLTSLDCSRRGLTFAAVHDCFWTHACTVDEMSKICREQFVNLHNQPIVSLCSDWMLSRYLTSDVTSILEKNDEDRYRKLFSPQVEPGELDINEVMKSAYFFS